MAPLQTFVAGDKAPSACQSSTPAAMAMTAAAVALPISNSSAVAGSPATRWAMVGVEVSSACRAALPLAITRSSLSGGSLPPRTFQSTGIPGNADQGMQQGPRVNITEAPQTRE